MHVQSDEPGANPWEEIVLSVLRMGTVLLRHRRRILFWTVVGALLGLGFAFARPRRYTALASFMPQSGGDANAGLKSIAGQFGIPIASATSAESPAFYQDLVSSPLILAPIAADSFSVSDGRAARQPFWSLMDLDSKAPPMRAEKATEKLQELVSASTDKNSGIITVTVTTRWRPVSIGVASKILQRVNDFNLRTRQSQASAERQFVEARLAVATAQLRAAEDNLQNFLEHNRQLDAPRIRFDQDRLQRKVALQQQVVATLSQSFEDAQLREVRDTPVITIIQTPTAKIEPDSRGALLLATTGIIAGAVFGILLALVSSIARTARAAGRSDAVSFSVALEETSRGLRSPFQHRSRSAP